MGTTIHFRLASPLLIKKNVYYLYRPNFSHLWAFSAQEGLFILATVIFS